MLHACQEQASRSCMHPMSQHHNERHTPPAYTWALPLVGWPEGVDQKVMPPCEEGRMASERVIHTCIAFEHMLSSARHDAARESDSMHIGCRPSVL